MSVDAFVYGSRGVEGLKKETGHRGREREVERAYVACATRGCLPFPVYNLSKLPLLPFSPGQLQKDCFFSVED